MNQILGFLLIFCISCIKPMEEKISNKNGENATSDSGTNTFPNFIPPQINEISDFSLDEGVSTFIIVDDGTDDLDGNGNPITYSCYYDLMVNGIVMGPTECNSLNGFFFDPVNGDFSWTPDQRAFDFASTSAGQYEFKIIAISASGTDEEIFVIDVNKINIPPSISIRDNYSITMGDNVFSNFDDANTSSDFDEDYDLINYTCTWDDQVNSFPDSPNNCNEHGFIFDSVSGEISGTPTRTGVYEFNVVADDGVFFISYYHVIKVGHDNLAENEEWIQVPANAGMLGVSSFWVMKYEAKAYKETYGNLMTIDNGDLHTMESESIPNISTHKPASHFDRKSWDSITPTNSASECESLGAGFRLITNKEWMAIAREAENIDENWTGQSVGLGCLYRGNSGETTIGSGSNFSDSCGYNGPIVDYGENRDLRAGHILTNGEKVFDMAGNRWEFVDWDDPNSPTLGVQGGPKSCTGSNIPLSSFSCLGYSPDDFKTFNNGLGINDGVGIVLFTDSSGYLGRGGMKSGINTGIFTLLTNYDASSSGSVGFRCVYRP